MAPAPLPPDLPALLDALLAPIEDSGDMVGALVLDATSGTQLYARHAHARSLPASTMKLSTTAAALAFLGTDYRFHTKVSLHGKQKGSVFNGDIVVTPSGDPSFGAQRFPETRGVCGQIATALANKGVRHWRGTLRVEGAAPGVLGPGWAWDDSAYDFSAAPGDFVFRENAVRMTVTRAETDRCDPNLAWTFDGFNGGLTAEIREETDYPGLGMECQRPPGAKTAFCTWHHRADLCPMSSSQRLSFDDPVAAFRSCLNRALRDLDVTVHEERGLDSGAEEPLLDVVSPPLSALVRVTNKESLNIYAECLALELAQEVSGTRTYEAVRDAMARDHAARGIAPLDLLQVDGSGLSRYNLATAAALAEILLASLGAPYGPALFDSLPVAGVDGTLQHHELDPGMVGRVRAKTGTLTGQRAFVGLAERPGDEAHPRLVFALMFGNLARPTSSTNETFDELARLLVNAPIRTPLVTAK